MLYRNCKTCDRITKHNLVTMLCVNTEARHEQEKEEAIRQALERYRQDSKEGARC